MITDLNVKGKKIESLKWKWREYICYPKIIKDCLNKTVKALAIKIINKIKT